MWEFGGGSSGGGSGGGGGLFDGMFQIEDGPTDRSPTDGGGGPDCVPGSSIAGMVVGAIADFIGGAGAGANRAGGTYRTRSGAAKGNRISPRHYPPTAARPSGWGGGSKAQIKTHSVANLGAKLTNIGATGNVLFGVADIVNNAASEGGWGPQTERAIAEHSAV